MRFGFELEVMDGAGTVLENLQQIPGMTDHDYLHDYHCGCGDCYYDRGGSFFAAQEDGSCDGEFITRILDYGSPEMDAAIGGISAALLRAGADCSGDVGNHVHVDRSGMDEAAQLRLMRIVGRYETDMAELASGRRSLRGYNGTAFEPSEVLWQDIAAFGTATRSHREYDYGTGRYTGAVVETPYKRSVYDYSGSAWLSWKSETVEFRLWNSTRAAWRIRMHVGVSVALVRAAIDGVDVVYDDRRSFEEVVGAYFDGPTWAGILRQRYSKGGMELAA